MLSTDNPFYRQVVLLIELLPLVGRESCFALKGGTAINLFIRDLPRLSVDIDLTYLPTESRADSLRHIDEALHRLGTAIETALRGARTLFPGRADARAPKFQVRRGRESVQIEVSPVLRGSVLAPEQREMPRKPVDTHLTVSTTGYADHRQKSRPILRRSHVNE